MCFCNKLVPGQVYCPSEKCQTEKSCVTISVAVEAMNKVFSLTADMPATPEEKAREENLRNSINSFPLFLREYQHIAKIKWVQYTSLISAGFTPEQALHLVKR